MHYAPINPSDLNFFQGFYGLRKTGFPIVGFEGSGVIEQADNANLIGKKVSIFADMSNGTHSTHMVTQPKNTILWPDSADLKLISMSVINPLSCIGMLNITKKENVKTILISAAASSLSKMMVRTIKQSRNFDVKNVIGMTRSRNTDSELLNIGFDEVISTEPQQT